MRPRWPGTSVYLGRQLNGPIGFHLRLVDAGGGLGIVYRDGEPELDRDELGVLDRWRVGARYVAFLEGGIHHALRPALVGTRPTGWRLMRTVRAPGPVAPR